MAVSNSLFVGKARKSAGNVTARNVQGRTILSEKVTTNTSKSFGQVRQRMAFKWTSQMARLMRPIIDHSFIIRGQYQSSTNAFTSHAISSARVIGAGPSFMNDYPFAPAPVLISAGNAQQYGADVVITGTGTTSQNVQTGFVANSAFAGISTDDYDYNYIDPIALTKRGLRAGQMVTFVVVVYRAGVGTLMEWKRVLLISENETKVGSSALYDSILIPDIGDQGTVNIISPYQLVGAAVIVSDVDGNGNVFDVSTSRLVTAPEAQLKLIYGGESLPELALANVYTASESGLRYEMPEMGWAVDEALLLNPKQLDTTDNGSDGMNNGFVPIYGDDIVDK